MLDAYIGGAKVIWLAGAAPNCAKVSYEKKKNHQKQGNYDIGLCVDVGGPH